MLKINDKITNKKVFDILREENLVEEFGQERLGLGTNNTWMGLRTPCAIDSKKTKG